MIIFITLFRSFSDKATNWIDFLPPPPMHPPPIKDYVADPFTTGIIGNSKKSSLSSRSGSGMSARQQK